MVRKIVDEHRALNGLFATALESLEGSGSTAGARTAFLELREALESHLAAEEELYFPTIWVLRADFKERLRAFIRAHQDFRGLVQEVGRLMDREETQQARAVLDRLRHEFSRHERSEEDVLRLLDLEILSDESRSQHP